MLILPFLLSKDPLLLWSIEVCSSVGKYLLHKVLKGFSKSYAGINLYFVWIFWWNVDTVRLFSYWWLFISKYEKTPVNVLQRLVLTNSPVFTESEGSEEFPKWAIHH